MPSRTEDFFKISKESVRRERELFSSPARRRIFHVRKIRFGDDGRSCVGNKKEKKTTETGVLVVC